MNDNLFSVWTDEDEDYKDLFDLSINDQVFYYDEDVTILQAILIQDIYLPRFCYHPKLKLVGNCRLCFIEEKKSTKPVISCSVNIAQDMGVFLESELAVQSRHNVLEFLLVNHPLDCPICDQGGECDLQDQYIVFGASDSRYYEDNKRNVIDKNLSPLIQLSLNRCIQCARCTRFAQDVAGLYSFTLLGRGGYTEISNYYEYLFSYELSGNIIDLCPVGALTSKFYNFQGRYWELIDQRHIDIFDILHPNIRLDFSGTSLLRILPVIDINLNEEWLSDIIRFNVDCYYQSRIINNVFKNGDVYIISSWRSMLLNLKFNYFNLLKFNYLKRKNIFHELQFSTVFSDYFSTSLYLLAFNKLNIFNIYSNNLLPHSDFRDNYYLENINFDSISSALFIGTNIRLEFPLINLKIRQLAFEEYIDLYNLGFITNLNFFFIHFSNSFKFFISYFTGSSFDFDEENNLIHIFIANYFAYSNLNSYIFLQNFFFLINYNDFYIYNLSSYNNNVMTFNELAKKTNFINKTLNINANTLFSWYVKGKDLIHNFIFNNSSIRVYTGHHADRLFDFANFIIPLKFFFESSCVYINLLGTINDHRVLYYSYIIPTAKEDFRFIKILFKKFGIKFTWTKDRLITNLYPRNYIYLKYNLIKTKILSSMYKININKNYFFNSFLNDFYLSIDINEFSYSMLQASKKLTFKNDFNYIFYLNFNKWIF